MQEEYRGKKFRNIKNSNSDSLTLTAFLAKEKNFAFSLRGIEICAIPICTRHETLLLAPMQFGQEGLTGEHCIYFLLLGDRKGLN